MCHKPEVGTMTNAVLCTAKGAARASQPAHPCHRSSARAHSRRACRTRCSWTPAQWRCPCLRTRIPQLAAINARPLYNAPQDEDDPAPRFDIREPHQEAHKEAGRGVARAVVVVLADEDGGQAPQPRYVERLKNLPLVGCTVAIPAPCNAANVTSCRQREAPKNSTSMICWMRLNTIGMPVVPRRTLPSSTIVCYN